MARPVLLAPAGAASSTLEHRVAFYETDAMGVVHHSNYVRFLELARVVWMDEHDRPYREYAAQGLHFATTAVELRYHRSAGFDDLLAVTTWMEWLRRASLRMAYEIRRAGTLVASGATEHAMVDLEGRPRGIPPERRAVLLTRIGAAPRS
ncbi:MAG: thioesterase family protein [Deltaproteobacteria bacterium]|nr:thioesterase family protein [Deltaproteobacteria bacterium]